MTEIINREVVRVAIYTRVSTEEQTRRDYNSLDSQLDICRAYIRMQQQNGWVEVKHYEDGGYSAKDLKRPAMQELLFDLKQGLIDCIIVYRIDRLTRSLRDFVEVWDLLEKHKVNFVSTSQNFDTTNAIGRLFLNVLLSFASYERELTSERVKDKAQARAVKGLWNGGWVPLGYKRDLPAGTLEIDSEDAKTIKKIFKLTKSLGSPTLVARALNEESLTTKIRTVNTRSKQKKKVGGKRFIGDYITRVVTNPFYAGMIRHNGEEFEGQHPAIVSKKLWHDANTALLKEDTSKVAVVSRNKNEVLLKSLARCGHCGHALTPKPGGRKLKDGSIRTYLTCVSVAKEGKNSKCELRSIPSAPFEELVINMIGQIGKHPKILKKTLEASQKEKNKSIRPLKSTLVALNKELAMTKESFNNYLALAKKGGDHLVGELMVEAEVLAKTKQEQEREIEKVKMEINFRESAVVDEKTVSQSLLKFDEVIRALEFKDKKELIELILKRVEVSRLDPENYEQSSDPSIQDLKIRTSLYRLRFQFFSDSLFIKTYEKVLKCSQKNENGGPGEIRTLDTITGILP
ncbi:MAG: recombinase family protein [Bacteroidota bacterium]